MPNTVVKMPQLGESVAEGTVGRWLKQPGDRVERDEPLVEIQTDKVNAEVPSPVAGILQRILLPEGTTASVKTDMAIIGDEPVADDAPTEAAPAAQGPEGINAQRTPAASAAAAPRAFTYDRGATGGVVGHRDAEPESIDAPAATSAPAAPAAPTVDAAPESADVDAPGRRFFTPVVLRMAEEHGLDLSRITGTGAHGRVTRKDVERAIADGSAMPTAPAPVRPSETPPQQAAPAVHAVAAPPPTAAGPQDRPLTPMRRAIADHMRRAHEEIPDAWSMTEIDVSRLVRHRAAVQEEWRAREGFELTYLPFFVKAVIAGLRAVPELNASFAGDHITVHHAFHLGIAVSVDGGLVVPVLRDADSLSIAGLARALRTLITRTRSGKVSREDLDGATFTVNNPGALGSVMSKPIVPVGQAGIVTMEAIVKRPVVTADDAIAIRSMMNSCLSFDHRVLDGAGALQFLRTLREQLETVDYPVY